MAWSGKGLIHNSGCSAGPLIPQLYTQTFGTSSKEMWDFSRASRPDAVIIYLGTNDYSCSQTTDTAFTAACVQLLRVLDNFPAFFPSPMCSSYVQPVRIMMSYVHTQAWLTRPFSIAIAVMFFIRVS